MIKTLIRILLKLTNKGGCTLWWTTIARHKGKNEGFLKQKGLKSLAMKYLRMKGLKFREYI